jgi:hypothetical protein
MTISFKSATELIQKKVQKGKIDKTNLGGCSNG